MIIGDKYINIVRRYEVDKIRTKRLPDGKSKFFFGFKSLDTVHYSLFEFDTEDEAHKNREKLIKRMEKKY